LSQKLKALATVVQMTAVDMDHVIWVNVIALMDIKVLIARKVSVRFYVQHMVIMVVEFVTVRMAGRAQNVTFQ
jgi:hypothetical protein